MNDVLSAASTLLAVLAILFGLWAPEINKAADGDNLPLPRRNHRPRYDGVRAIFRAKAIPLTLFALTITLIFIPAAVGIVNSSITHVHSKGLGGYNVVMTSVVAVTLFSGVLTGYLLVWAFKINSWLKRNDPEQ